MQVLCMMMCLMGRCCPIGGLNVVLVNITRCGVMHGLYDSGRVDAAHFCFFAYVPLVQ